MSAAIALWLSVQIAYLGVLCFVLVYAIRIWRQQHDELGDLRSIRQALRRLEDDSMIAARQRKAWIEHWPDPEAKRALEQAGNGR